MKQEFIKMFEAQLKEASKYVKGLWDLQTKYKVPTELGWVEQGVYLDTLALSLDNGLIYLTVEHNGWESSWAVTMALPEDVDATLAILEADILIKRNLAMEAQKRMQEAADLLQAETDRKEFERLKKVFGQ